MANKRSGWEYFSKVTLEKVPKKTKGVYWIRGNKQIKRCGGTDKKGILYIGEGNMRRRLKIFWAVADGRRKVGKRGAGATTYWNFYYDKKFPPESLQFCYEIIKNKNKAQKEEGRLLNKYRMKFLDGPPLNSSKGKNNK